MLRYIDNVHTQLFMPGEPVVFLHAFPVNHKMWQSQFDFLELNKMGYLALDYPGFGKSTLIEKEMHIEDYSEYVYGLLQEIGVHKAIIVGLSMGGYVAFSLYRDHPEVFAGLLLANTRASADNEEGKQKRYQMVDSLKKTLDLLPIIDSHMEKFFTEKTRKDKPELVNHVHHLMQESTVAGVIQAQKAMGDRPDSQSLLKKMDFPVRIIAGEQDGLTPVAGAQQMADANPAAKLHVIPEAAHLSNVEQPEKFNHVLWELIEEVKVVKNENLDRTE